MIPAADWYATPRMFLMHGVNFAHRYLFRAKGTTVAPTIEEAERMMAMRGDKMLKLVTRSVPRSAAAAAAAGGEGEPVGAEDEDAAPVESDDERFADYAKGPADKDAAAALQQVRRLYAWRT